MCGISLIINTKNNPVEESQIRSMNNKVVHRGPDDEGFYFGKHFAFGHRRLCILDLTRAGHQPMIRDNYALNYNGEIYNYLELIEELKGLGHIFKTHADTEVILPAYWEWGVESFSRFNGMWAFMIYDPSKDEIILCRDRFGAKPLYYTIAGDLFMAASEIKQFTVIPEFKPVLNKKATVNFLTRGLLNYSEETFFEGVQELRPGHYMKYNLVTHEVTIQQWYDLNKSPDSGHPSEKEAREKVNALLGDSIRIRMRADVQVGSCLSGGIDSSSIVSFIHENGLANEHFKTVTSCYADKTYDEQEFSDVVTKQTGFESIKVFPDLDQLLETDYLNEMIYFHDQPFSGASHYSELSVFRAARENGIVVLLDGQGSDEYFCGYDEYLTLYLKSLIRKGRFGKAWRCIRDKSSLQGVSMRKQWQGFLRAAYWYPLLTGIKKIIGKSPFPWLKDSWQPDANQIPGGGKPAVNMKELSIQEVLYTSLPYQLHSADRSSMAFSLEVREPFLDFRLLEYVIGLPDDYKIKKGYSKYVLREAVSSLPPEVKLRNHKMGFVAPDKPWVLRNKTKIRSELSEAVENSSIFSGELVSRFDRFTEGHLDYEPLYFRVIALNRFCKIFNMQLS